MCICIWPTAHICQVDPNLDLDKGRAPVPHFTYPVMGLFDPACDLPTEKEQMHRAGAHPEGDDAVLAHVKIESAPAMPLTAKRRSDLKRAQDEAAGCDKWTRSVAERWEVVDLTGGDVVDLTGAAAAAGGDAS